MVVTKGVGVVGAPMGREAVVEGGDMLGDFDEPFSHQMVLQSLPVELGPWHCAEKETNLVRSLDSGEKHIQSRRSDHGCRFGYSDTWCMGQIGHIDR